MKAVTRYQTRDNKLHEDLRDAKRHADECYGAQVCELAQELLATTKYQDMLALVDSDRFRGKVTNLLELHQDTLFLDEEEG